MTANKDKRPKFEGEPVYRILIQPLTLGGFSVSVETEAGDTLNGASFGADDLASALAKLRALIDPPAPTIYDTIGAMLVASPGTVLAPEQPPKIKVEGEFRDLTGPYLSMNPKLRQRQIEQIEAAQRKNRDELIAAGVLPGVDTPDPELAKQDAEIEKTFVDTMGIEFVVPDSALGLINAERAKHGRPTLAQMPELAGCAWMLKYVKATETVAAHYAAECQLCGAEVVAAGHETQAQAKDVERRKAEACPLGKPI